MLKDLPCLHAAAAKGEGASPLRPVFDLETVGRPKAEQEADYFAACLLVPVKLLVSAFEFRFGTQKPLPLTDAVAFYLWGARANELFSAPAGSLAFAKAVASARSFNLRRFQSLAEQFGVSVSALAIRLRETRLVLNKVRLKRCRPNYRSHWHQV